MALSVEADLTLTHATGTVTVRGDGGDVLVVDADSLGALDALVRDAPRGVISALSTGGMTVDLRIDGRQVARIDPARYATDLDSSTVLSAVARRLSAMIDRLGNRR